MCFLIWFYYLDCILKYDKLHIWYRYQPTLKDSEYNLQVYWLQSTKKLWRPIKTITVNSDSLKTKFYESFNTDTQPSVGKKCYAFMFGKQKEIFSPGWQGRCMRVVECGPSGLLHHILASRERHIYYGAAAQRSPGIIRAILSTGEIRFVIQFNVYNTENVIYSSFVTPLPYLSIKVYRLFFKLYWKQYATLRECWPTQCM